MNREDIIRMAREAGWEMDDSLVLEPEVIWYISQGQIERFAALVAFAERESLRESFRVVAAAEASAAILHEREACAKVADKYIGADPIAAAIRARGDA